MGYNNTTLTEDLLETIVGQNKEICEALNYMIELMEASFTEDGKRRMHITLVNRDSKKYIDEDFEDEDFEETENKEEEKKNG